MKTRKMLSFLVACVLLTGCATQQKPQDEQRIVATSVATLEILDALEVDGVVGIPDTQSYDIPERYEGLTGLGSPMQPNMETVKSLEPTIVLSPNSLEGELKPQYDAIDVDSYFLNLKSVDGMYQAISELGDMFDRQQQAKELNDAHDAFMSKYHAQNNGKNPPRVLILMGLPGSYVVASESSYVGSLVKLAGGINVYGDGDGKDFLNINTEDMLEKQPDMILRTSHAMPEQVQIMFDEEFETNDIWKHFDAVKQDAVYDLDHSLFGMSATFRYQEALKEIQPILFGE